MHILFFPGAKEYQRQVIEKMLGKKQKNHLTKTSGQQSDNNQHLQLEIIINNSDLKHQKTELATLAR